MAGAEEVALVDVVVDALDVSLVEESSSVQPVSRSAVAITASGATERRFIGLLFS
ncbi:hypothetical protein [Corynebacterium variabile]|uniref:hypothetical protein n=1 Tax=Corynebacterium variabile TaxID=1727 RepID=UPI002899232C|nr:hypothetical protein [Corynebacterium variabile]